MESKTFDQFEAAIRAGEPCILSHYRLEKPEQLLSLSDIEQLILSANAIPGSRNVDIVKDGFSLPLKPPLINDSGLFNLSQVLVSFNQGYTIILNSLHRRWPSINRWCKKLEIYLQESLPVLMKGGVRANAYLTPSDSRGFSAHYDAEEIFIVQLEGSKHWRIFEPVQINPIKPQGGIPDNQLSGPLIDEILSRGKVLYIPRGYVHEGRAVNNDSLHLTVYYRSFTWVDIISEIASSIPDLRSAIQLSPLSQEEDIDHHWRDFQQHILNMQDLQKFREAFYSLIGSHFEQLSLSPADIIRKSTATKSLLETKTPLRKIHGPLCSLKVDTNQIVLSYPGNSISLPIIVEPILNHIIHNSVFNIEELPLQLSEDQNITLIRRLISEGFLEMAIK